MATLVDAPLARHLAPPLFELLRSVIQAADHNGASLFLVGGPVRDLLLRRPLRDLDLCLAPQPGLDAERLARRAAPPTGARIWSHGRFGTVRLATAAASLDISAMRSESYPRPGALPEVRAGDLDADLRRRDFTVNAMAVPLTRPARRSSPSLVDPGGGQGDLARRQLRVFHARSFCDDPTRALRGARFAGRFGLRLAAESRRALDRAVREGAFDAVSGERWRRELEYLFADGPSGLDPARALVQLGGWGVLSALVPGLVAPCPQERRHLRQLRRTLADPPWPLRPLRPWVTGMALWLAAADPPRRRAALQRLRIDGSPAARIEAFAENAPRWLGALCSSRGRGALDRCAAEHPEELFTALYCRAPAALRRRLRRWAAIDRERRLPVRGDEIAALGLSGAAIGEALAALRVAFLDRRCRDRDRLLAYARARWPAGAADPPGPGPGAAT